MMGQKGASNDCCKLLTLQEQVGHSPWLKRSRSGDGRAVVHSPLRGEGQRGTPDEYAKRVNDMHVPVGCATVTAKVMGMAYRWATKDLIVMALRLT